MSDQTSFTPVTFEKERLKILADLAERLPLMTAMASDGTPFVLHPAEIKSGVIHAELADVPVRGPKASEALQVLFSFPEGQYLLHAQVISVDPGGKTVGLAIGKELMRLQRRNNFRVSLGTNSRVSFKMTSFRTSNSITANPEVIDLSAGGMRVIWPMAAAGSSLSEPKVEDPLSGQLALPNGRQLEVFGAVRSVMPTTREGRPVFLVGLEFKNLSTRDEQTLLFVCMQVLRQNQPVKS